MSDIDPADQRRQLNEYSWLTTELFQQFLRERGVPTGCNVCHASAWQIETGAKDGYVARSIIMPMLRENVVNISDGRYLPVVRMRCLNCGNVRYHDMFAIDLWRKQKAIVEATKDAGNG